MIEIIFATNNKNKIKEVSPLLKNIKLLSLSEIDIFEEVPENGDTLQENALEKAMYVFNKTNKICFADDTGLEIDFLNNRPGVFSARYAGEDKNSQNNMNKVLLEMQNTNNRKAQFRTVIALVFDKSEYYFFEGKVEGEMLTEKRGNEGFGYDPIFKPNGYDLSFAEMDLNEKNKISHRALATKKLIEFLNKNY